MMGLLKVNNPYYNSSNEKLLTHVECIVQWRDCSHTEAARPQSLHRSLPHACVDGCLYATDMPTS